MGIAGSLGDRIAVVLGPAKTVGGEADRESVALIAGSVLFAALEKQGLVASSGIRVARVVNDVATAGIDEDDVVVPRSFVFDKTEVGSVPEDAVARRGIAVHIQQVVRVEPHVRPLRGVFRPHLADTHAAVAGIPHSQQTRIFRVAHHVSVERDPALPGVEWEHQWITGVLGRLMERVGQALQFVDDEVIQKQLLFGTYLN